jgi:hypothetical protein
LHFNDTTMRWELLIKENPPPLKDTCLAKYCRGFRRHFLRSNGKLYMDRFCSKCRDRLITANNRVNRLYLNLKSSAKRRRIPFELSRSEFHLFCIETNYYERIRNNAASLVVDRIDNTLGYTFSNIQILSHTENSEKRHHENGLSPTFQSSNSDDPF